MSGAQRVQRRGFKEAESQSPAESRMHYPHCKLVFLVSSVQAQKPCAVQTYDDSGKSVVFLCIEVKSPLPESCRHTYCPGVKLSPLQLVGEGVKAVVGEGVAEAVGVAVGD